LDEARFWLTKALDVVVMIPVPSMLVVMFLQLLVTAARKLGNDQLGITASELFLRHLPPREHANLISRDLLPNLVYVNKNPELPEPDQITFALPIPDKELDEMVRIDFSDASNSIELATDDVVDIDVCQASEITNPRLNRSFSSSSLQPLHRRQQHLGFDPKFRDDHSREHKPAIKFQDRVDDQSRLCNQQEQLSRSSTNNCSCNSSNHQLQVIQVPQHQPPRQVQERRNLKRPLEGHEYSEVSVNMVTWHLPVRNSSAHTEQSSSMQRPEISPMQYQEEYHYTSSTPARRTTDYATGDIALSGGGNCFFGEFMLDPTASDRPVVRSITSYSANLTRTRDREGSEPVPLGALDEVYATFLSRSPPNNES